MSTRILLKDEFESNEVEREAEADPHLSPQATLASGLGHVSACTAAVISSGLDLGGKTAALSQHTTAT